MLTTVNLTHQYPKTNPIFFPDIECPTGQSLLILGQSGAGKSTLLHLLGGLMHPTAGDVLINDVNLHSMTSSELDSFRGKNIGIVFQKAHFISALTVAENLHFTRKLAGLPKDKKRILNVLDRLAIPHKLNSKPDDLSIGEQQRFSIARAIITQPTIILADEPTSALDDENCYRVIDLLKSQAKMDQSSLIIVTHDQRLRDVFDNSITLEN